MSISPFGRKGVTSATVEPCLSGTCCVVLIVEINDSRVRTVSSLDNIQYRIYPFSLHIAHILVVYMCNASHIFAHQQICRYLNNLQFH